MQRVDTRSSGSGALLRTWLALALVCAAAAVEAEEASWVNVGSELGVELPEIRWVFRADGAVWASARDALYEIRADTWRAYTEPGTVRSLVQDGAGTMWAAGRHPGLWRLRDGVWARWQGAIGAAIDAQVSAANATCYTWGHPIMPDPEVYDGIPYTGSRELSMLAVTPDGSLWLLFTNPTYYFPVWRFTPGQTARPRPAWEPPPDVLASGPVTCWQMPWAQDPMLVSLDMVPAGTGVHVLVCDADQVDATYVATYSGAEWEVRNGPQSAYRLCTDVDGLLWASGEHLLQRLDGATWQVVHERTGGFAPGSRPAPDPRGGVWCVFDSVVHATAEGKTLYAPPAGQPRDLVLGPGGVPWVATDLGLWRMVLPGTAVEATTWGSVKRGAPPAR